MPIFVRLGTNNIPCLPPCNHSIPCTTGGICKPSQQQTMPQSQTHATNTLFSLFSQTPTPGDCPVRPTLRRTSSPTLWHMGTVDTPRALTHGPHCAPLQASPYGAHFPKPNMCTTLILNKCGACAFRASSWSVVRHRMRLTMSPNPSSNTRQHTQPQPPSHTKAHPEAQHQPATPAEPCNINIDK